MIRIKFMEKFTTSKEIINNLLCVGFGAHRLLDI